MADKSPTTVEAVDPAKKTSTILGPMSDEATVRMDQQDEGCLWNDEKFSQGDQVMLGDDCYECSFGRWVKVV